MESGPFAPVASDACGEVDLTYTESVSGDPCEAQNLIRIWTATDQSGNTATCVQTLTIVPLDIADVVFPPRLLVNVEKVILLIIPGGRLLMASL
jgi:hypothetical protein